MVWVETLKYRYFGIAFLLVYYHYSASFLHYDMNGSNHYHYTRSTKDTIYFILFRFLGFVFRARKPNHGKYKIQFMLYIFSTEFVFSQMGSFSVLHGNGIVGATLKNIQICLLLNEIVGFVPRRKQKVEIT